MRRALLSGGVSEQGALQKGCFQRMIFKGYLLHGWPKFKLVKGFMYAVVINKYKQVTKAT